MIHTLPEFPPPVPVPTSLPEAADLHALVVLNRYSSNYPKAMKQYEQIQQLGYAGLQDYVETLPAREDTIKAVGEKLTAKSPTYNAVIILTGDGGANTVARALYKTDDVRLEQTPIVFGTGGGACDGHHMTQGKNKDYIPNLPGQNVTTLFPLEIVIRNDDAATPVEIALFHTGIGQSSQISYNVNSPAHRGSWLIGHPYLHQLQEGITGARSFLKTRSFLVEQETTGHYTKTVEWTIVNGNRMGRRNIFPGDLSERGFDEAFVPTRKHLLKYAAKLMVGQDDCFEHMTNSIHTVKSQSPKHVLRIHFDGETADLSTRTDEVSNRVEVTASTRPLYVASRLHKP